MTRIGPDYVDSDRAYAVAAAFFAELQAHGVHHAVISPGSRSTPLAITAHHTPGMSSWVQLDERSAGFFALGLARKTRRPVVLICTSGTAAANYLPAVIEAHYSRIPLLVCTADRPPELRQWGAGQTVDQVRLYGSHVRWFTDVPVASDTTEAFAQRLAARAVLAATGSDAGPVHCNWPLREPLPPVAWRPAESQPAGAQPPGPTVRLGPASTAATPEQITRLAQLTQHERGLVIVGPTDQPELDAALAQFSRSCDWPIYAEPTSQLRTNGVGRISTLDSIVRSGAAADHRPEVVVRIGLPPTSKATRLWLEEHPPEHHVLVDPAGHLIDPSALCTEVLAVGPAHLLNALPPTIGEPASGDWNRWWSAADHAASTAVAIAIDDGPCTEPSVVRAVAAALPADGTLYVSNSMPVRDVDSFFPATPESATVYANRGAAGIDGLHSCALGVAAAGEGPVVLLTGDIAFLHDIGGLLAGIRLGLSLTVVVVDNGGGQIFSFLPIAAHGDSVAFRELFTTPPGFDFDDLLGITGLAYASVQSREAIDEYLPAMIESPGINVLRVEIDPAQNLAQHRELDRLVAAAVGAIDG